MHLALSVQARQLIVLSVAETGRRARQRRLKFPPTPAFRVRDAVQFPLLCLCKEVASMKPVPDEVFLRQLQWRYATKKFDPARKISPDDWRTLEQALVHAPVILRPATVEVLCRHRAGASRESSSRRAGTSRRSPTPRTWSSSPSGKTWAPQTSSGTSLGSPRFAVSPSKSLEGFKQMMLGSLSAAGRGSEHLGDASSLHRPGLLLVRCGHARHRRLPAGRASCPRNMTRFWAWPA